jgi:hypothetical protein
MIMRSTPPTDRTTEFLVTGLLITIRSPPLANPAEMMYTVFQLTKGII